ncbi:uncharacterized protein LDX57_009090 [Aspergillus melleus]|uniref:uncharacterized protein n=1 Tax=Aspergillus melleus TaxID=138277 RepID=UPI001E8D5086|nr:uncharacterized protein LDX57_009090 [Aspergillus melleus]KAH8431429.1 hypothetical protein LDX57_009090 [Aspergillus melleus]
MSLFIRQFRSRIPRVSRVQAVAIRAQSSQVANPRSSNPESQAINVSRGKESRHDDTPDSRSVQSPISSQSGPTSETHEGEEATTTTEQVHNDPNKPAGEKRRNVEQAGRRPMGPEDEK